MARPRRRTRAEQQAETRRRIVEAAAEVFATHGFEGASIDAITERAGFSRGAFYSNFSSKAELLVELSRARMAAFAEDVLPGLLEVEPDERVARASEWIADQAAPDELLLLVELGRVRDRSPDAVAVIDDFLGGATDFIEEVLSAAAPDHQSRSAEERQRLGTAMLTVLTGVQLVRHLGVEVDAETVALLLRAALLTDVDA